MFTGVAPCPIACDLDVNIEAVCDEESGELTITANIINGTKPISFYSPLFSDFLFPDDADILTFVISDVEAQSLDIRLTDFNDCTLERSVAIGPCGDTCPSGIIDCEGICDGNAMVDCNGDCNGTAVTDCAGNCNGTATTDCNGDCNGTAVIDCAGVCGGTAIVDCNGDCNGTAVIDCAGVCGGTAIVDCNGDCNGTAVIDCAGDCNGSATTDCNGICNGTAVPDCEGICGGNNIPDCTGACYGAGTAPSFDFCPADIYTCTEVVSWEMPTISDDCGVAMIVSVVPPSGSIFEAGSTEVLITASDDWGNESECSFMVTYNAIDIEFVSSDYNGYGISCEGASDGSLEAIVSGGLPGYSYQWSNDKTDDNISQLNAGTYGLTVVDDSGCSTSAEINLTATSPLQCTASASGVLCPEADGSYAQLGSINLDLSGGISTLPYSTQLYNGNTLIGSNSATSGSNENLYQDLPIGSYSLLIRDANDCTCEQFVDIESSTSLVIDSGPGNISEGSNGGVTPFYYNYHEISVSGGSGLYQFDWDRTGYVRWEIDGGNVNILYADNAEWSVTITDTNGCSSEYILSNLDGDNTSAVDGDYLLDIDEAIITGVTDSAPGAIDVTVSGCDGGPYIYTWDGPADWTITSPETEDLADIPGGWYTLTVSCADGSYTQGWYWVPYSRSTGRLKSGDLTESELSIHPNPITQSSILEYALSESGTASLQIFNVEGKSLMHLSLGRAEAKQFYQIDMGRLSEQLGAGLYQMQLLLDSEIHSSGSFVLVE